MTSLNGIAANASVVRRTLRARSTAGLLRVLAAVAIVAPVVAHAQVVNVTNPLTEGTVASGTGAPNVAIDSFAVQSSTTVTVPITSVTLTFTSTSATAAEWVQAVRITSAVNGGGTLYGTASSVTSNTVVVTTSGFTAPRSNGAALTAYVSIDLKAAPTGAAGTTTSLTALVTTLTSPGTMADTRGTVTVDNAPPSNATWGTNTATAGQVVLNWTNPGTDFGQEVIVRRTTSTFTSLPSEGVLPAVNDTWADGSVVVYVGTGTTFTDAVAAGTYYYKIFAGDAWENWAAGVATGALVATAPSNTTALGSGSDPAAATICPGAAATYVDQLAFTVAGTNDTVSALTVPLAGSAGVGGAVAQVELRNSAGASFVPAKLGTIGGDTATFSGAALPANVGTTTYQLWVTPNGHAGITGSPTLQARVSAFTATNSTSGSDTASTFTLDNTAAANPGWGTVTAGNAQVVLNWTNPGGDAVQVMVVRKLGQAAPSGAPTDGVTYAVNDPVGDGTVVYVGASASPLTFTDTTTANNSSYWYEIYARDACLNWSSGAPTATYYTPVGVAAPSAPGPITFSLVTQTSVTVSWGAATGTISGYKLERAPDAGGAPGAWAQVYAPATTSQADSGLTPGARYWYRVRAWGTGGDGPYNAQLATSMLPATTAVGDGVNPTSPPSPLCPAGAATPIDAFTLVSTGAADAITSVTVNLSPAGAFQNLGTVEVTDDGGVSKGAVTPGGNSVVVILGSAIASPLTSTQYKLRITPKAHGAMPPGATGQSFATTAVVAAIAGVNPGPTYGDASSAIVTVDNQAPASPAWGAVTPGASKVDVTWTNPGDADVNQVVILRKAGGPVTESLTDGSTYTAGGTVGGSTVAYAGAITPASASITGLTAAGYYYFKIFARDACLNFSAGVPVGPVPVNVAGVVEGDPTKGTTAPTLAIINPVKNATVTGAFRVQVRVFIPSGTISASNISLNTDGSATAFPITGFIRKDNYGVLSNVGVFETTITSGLVNGASYTLRAHAINGAAAANSAGVPIRYNSGTAAKGDGNLLRRDNSSQLCNDCHNLPPHSSETSGSQYGSWSTVCADCHSPHGTTNIYLIDNPITPPAVSGYQGPKAVYLSAKTGYSATGGASNKAAAGFANFDNTGICQACHTRTSSVLGNTSPRFRNTGAADGHYTNEPATTSVSMTTAPCSACHQHSTGFAPTGKHCKDCHLTAAGGADVESWAWGDSLAALISVDEWTTRGHGSTAAYPSGNVGAGFDTQGNALGDRGCLYCHSSSTSHNDSTNFFRLNPANKGVTSVYVGYGPGDGWNSVCLICHGKTATYSSPGFDPDGTGTDYALINGTKKLGSDHYAHAAGNPNGGTYCWDCHDPHGDKSSAGNDLWFMIQRRPVMATTGTDSGVPLTLAANVEFRANLGATGSATAIDYPDYVYPPPPGTPVSGICRVCHTTKSGTTGTNHYNQSTTTDSHPDGVTPNTLPRVGVGLSPRDRCTDCHQHAKQCNECHAAPQTAGRHPKHNEVALLPTSYTDVSPQATATAYGFRCGKCHQGTHPKDTNDGSIGFPFVSDTIFDATANPKNTGASYVRGGTVSTVQGVAGGDYATKYWGYTDGTCSNLYCHSNAAPLGGTNTFIPINWLTGATTTCTSCHDTAGAATTLSPAHRLHTDPAKYNLACERCHTATGTKTAITNKLNHVNGVKDVAFDTSGVDNHLGSYTGATAYTCSNTYCHSSGASRTAPYTSGPSTAWNANTTCTSCHAVGSTLLTTGKHPAHINNSAVIGTNFTCTNCHASVVGAGNPPAAILSSGFAAHVDGTPTVSFATIGTFSGGSYSGGSCSSFYCHSTGQATPSPITIAWTGAALGCNGCHGVGTTYGDPNYANGGAGVATANSHAKHVSVAADCGSCHGATTTNGTAIVSASTTHINGAREVAISSTYGASATYTSGTKTCSNVNCHGTGSPQWGATLPCGDCHLGAADSDNWVINDGIMSVIGSTEWTYSGHAKTTAYDVSGNPGAAFAGTNPCVYCHDASVSHKVTTNPFRLANVGGADGMNGNCLICHKTSSPGFTPSGYTAKNRTTSKAVDDTHYGAKHAAGNNGGKPCWDCHDPHGDRSNSTTGNIYMVHSKVAKQTDGTYGLPTTTVATTFTAHATGTDYAQSVSPWSGICNVCHATTTHYTSTAGDSHNSTTACLSCHSHTDPTYTVNEGFKPKAGGDCLGCHGTQAQGPRRAVTADFADGPTPFRSHHAGSATTNTFKGTLTNFDCVVCHAEGTVSGGQTATTAKHNDGLCANAKHCIDLRNVDTPTTSYPYDKRAVCVAAGGTAVQCDTASTSTTATPWGNLVNWSTGNATWRTETSTKLDVFCLTCHDANGASGLSAAGLLQTGATATNPYADTTLTNNYDQAVRSAPVNIKDMVAGSLGTYARHAIRGQSASVYTVYQAITGQTCTTNNKGSTTTVPCKTMFEQGLFQVMAPADAALPSYWNDTSQMGCADCHTSDGSNGVNGNAHGANSEYLLKDSTSGATKGTQGTSSVAGTYVCYKCHFDSPKSGHSGSGSNFVEAVGLVGTARAGSKGSVFGLSCMPCHGGAPGNGEATQLGFGRIHGTNQVFYIDTATGPGTRNAYRFTNGGGLRFYDPGSWNDAVAYGLGGKSCYTLSTADTWSGCTQHGSGYSGAEVRGSGTTVARPLSY